MQVIRFLGVALGVLLLSFLALVVGLLATNPSPDPMPRWLDLAEMPVPRGEVGTAIVPGDQPRAADIYVVGGFEGLGSASDLVGVYDTIQNNWEEAPRLPEPRHHPGTAALGSTVYVTGGAVSARDWNERDELWALPEGAATWEELEPMPEPRAAHRMVAHDGRLYVIGGHGPSSRVLTWTPDEGWSTAAELPGPRHHLAVVVRDEEIWAIGGRDEEDTVLDRVDIYDPATDSWREGPPLPRPLSAAVEGVIDGRIHLVGGEDPALVGGGTFDEHLVLEPEGTDWDRAEPAPLAVHGAAGGVVDGRLYVIGGAARQGLLSVLSWTGYAASYDPAGAGGAGQP